MSTSSAATGGAGALPSKEAASPLDAYDVISSIGKGSFGNVSKIRRKADGRILVWKELNYGSMRDKEKQLVVSEVNILRELRHPFIVRYYDRLIDKSSSRIFIVMEYCEGGDLGYLIKKARTDSVPIDEEFIWRVFTQIVIALKECHRHRDSAGKVTPILHRDIKPGNIFMDAAQNIKIGDFGLAKELTSESKFATTNVGTPFYMSPEMINEMKYNEKSDIWALGCLLYELCALVPPFDACNHLSLAVKINAGKFDRIPTRYSEDLHRAIRWMLSLESAKRPSIEELEKIPKIRMLSRESGLIVKEYTLNHQHANKLREWKLKEDELAKREAAVVAAERALREKEASYTARLYDLQRREGALGAPSEEENRRHSTGDRPRASSITAPAPALTNPIPLHRAHSPGDVFAQPMAFGGDRELKRVRSMSSNVMAGVTGMDAMTSGATAPSLRIDSVPASSGPASRPSTASSTASISSITSYGAFAVSTPFIGEDTEMSATPSYAVPAPAFRSMQQIQQPVSVAFSGASMAAKLGSAQAAASDGSRGVLRPVGGI